MKASELLRKFDWCQGVYAKDINGRPTNLYGDDVTCLCAEGALYRSLTQRDGPFDTKTIPYDVKRKIEDKLTAEVLGVTTGAFKSFHSWNDAPERTKEEVIALLVSVGE